MAKTRTIAVVVASLLVVGVAGAVMLLRSHFVDPAPAVRFGDDYFSNLQQGDLDHAFAMYTDGFLKKEGEQWRKVLTDLSLDTGGVTSFRAVASSVAPVTLHNSEVIPCVLARYQVTRDKLITNEKLTICPNQRGDEYAIAGHEITRVDNGLHLAAGLTIFEKAIFSTSDALH